MSRSRSLRAVLALLAFAWLALSGCVVETPTPSLVDPTGFVTFVHPTGVFTLSMPPDWIVNDASDDYALNVEFSPPGVPDPLIGVYVVSADLVAVEPTGEGEDVPDEDAVLESAIAEYQSVFYDRNDLTYKEIARDVQPDGSLRIKFLIDAPQGTTQHNDFVRVSGPYFVALRVRLPQDQAQFRTLTRVIDTFTLNQEAGWRSLIEAADEAGSQDVVGFANLNAWADRNGGFVIVGQVVDNADQALEFVRITARLYDAENRLMAEQDDFVSSDMVLPGEFAPFSIVFSDGLPPGTIRYDLDASARYADFTAQAFYGPGNFALSSQAEFNDSGFLVIGGQVRNEGNLTANLVKVIVTVFDEEQRVIGTDTTLVNVQRLAPGEASAFSVIFVELGGVPNTFLVTAQGVVEE